MPLSEKFSELAAYIASPEYLLAARHPDHPAAFTRDRKLPLASLVAVLLCCMRMSIQSELDCLFSKPLIKSYFVDLRRGTRYNIEMFNSRYDHDTSSITDALG